MPISFRFFHDSEFSDLFFRINQLFGGILFITNVEVMDANPPPKKIVVKQGFGALEDKKHWLPNTFKRLFSTKTSITAPRFLDLLF